MAKIKDPKTGEEREETAEEKKAREDEEAARASLEEDEDDEDLEADEWKQKYLRLKVHARKWEKRAKTNAGAAAELQTVKTELEALKNTDKTDDEKAKAARAESDARTKKAETELLRLRVAMRKGLNETQAKRLVGETEEELETDADELLKTFKPAGGDGDGDGKQPRRRPGERIRPGTGGRDEEPPLDAKSIVDKAMERTTNAIR